MKHRTAFRMLAAVVCLTATVLTLAATQALTDLQRIEQAQALLSPLETRLTPLGVTNYRNIRTRLNTLKTQLLPAPEPVDCVLGAPSYTSSSPWGVCEPSGTQTRTDTYTPTVLTPEANGGQACDLTPYTVQVSQPCLYTPPQPPAPVPVECGQPLASSAHPYYAQLALRGDCLAAYSLRNQAQIEQYRRSKDKPTAVTYDPAMDAAKLTITGSSLTTQLWLPINVAVPFRGVFISWDAWFGKEFDKSLTGVGQYKAWNFCSPVDEIWSEVNTVFHASDPVNVAHLAGRYYNGAERGPNVTGVNDLTPQVGQFSIKADTWTRFYALFETDAAGWDTYSLWASDGTREPVQIFDKLQLKARLGKLGMFRLEYNTSSTVLVQSPKIAYVRNVVMLKGVTDVAPLLVKP